MKRILLLILLPLFLLACGSDDNLSGPEDAGELIKAATNFVNYPQHLKLGRQAQLKARLQIGYPCYQFARFELRQDGKEIFITPFVRQTSPGCSETEIPISEALGWRPAKAGQYLLHFYQADESYYSFIINVTE